jgi:hypothetical protein
MDKAAPVIGQPEYENLLVVTQFLLPLRYNQDKMLLERLRALLGGREVMIQSPLYQEIVAESKREGQAEAWQQSVMDVLVRRFGPAAQALDVELKAVEFDRLRDLHGFAISCRSLASFRKRFLS